MSCMRKVKSIGSPMGITVSSSMQVVLSSVDTERFSVFPGFCDVHVHFREPGFSYKETILSGSRAAARGGYTAVCTMPNLNPVPDSAENLDKQIKLIENDAVINVYPYASITVNQKGEELSHMEEIKDKCIAFSDDGRGVQRDDMMEAAMLKAKSLGKMIGKGDSERVGIHDVLDDDF